MNLFRYQKATSSFKVAMDYVRIYEYVWRVFYSPYDAWVFYWQGKALLLWFFSLRLQVLGCG